MSRSYKEIQTLKYRYPSLGIVEDVDRIAKINTLIEELGEELEALKLHILDARPDTEFSTPSALPLTINVVKTNKYIKIVKVTPTKLVMGSDE